MQPDRFYSPWQVQKELRTLTDDLRRGAAPPDPDPVQRGSLGSWWPLETKVCIRGDIHNALTALRETSELHYQVVFQLNVPDPDRKPDAPRVSVASLARLLGHDWETIWRANIDGIGWMSRHLGWAGDMKPWDRRTR